ncbi:MAG: hypothetical protein DRH24_17245 [Deltaproteobacteria bacterium]|nr:MAG: hypothetical protein DRH24_17245 [Deltaproteobacteria bacterium]
MADQSPKPLPIQFIAQNPNEQVYYLFRRSFVTNLPWMVLMFMLLIISFVFLPYSEQFSFWTSLSEEMQFILLLLWILAVCGYGLMNLVRWYFEVFLVTDKRVLDIDMVGFLYRNVAEAQLKSIQDVSHTQGGVFQLLFNFGNVYIQTAGTVQNIEVKEVSNPGLVHDIVTDLASQIDE